MMSRRPHKYWNFFNTLCEIVSFMREENLEYVPSYPLLKKKKRLDLNNAILKNGGYRLFRSALHQEQIRDEIVDFGDDALEYYSKHHKGLTRGQLQIDNKKLYDKLWRGGLLDKLPRKTAKRQNFGKDPLEYYNKHHKGLTRGQLKNTNPSLYARMRNEELLKHLPRELAKYQDFGEDPLAYFEKNHAGSTIEQLIKDNYSLYRRLKKDDLLKNIPREKAKRQDFGGDPLAYYKTHYPDLNRSELRKQNEGLYTRLRKDGLLHQVPTINGTQTKDLLEGIIDEYIGGDCDE